MFGCSFESKGNAFLLLQMLSFLAYPKMYLNLRVKDFIPQCMEGFKSKSSILLVFFHTPRLSPSIQAKTWSAPALYTILFKTTVFHNLYINHFVGLTFLHYVYKMVTCPVNLRV